MPNKWEETHEIMLPDSLKNGFNYHYIAKSRIKVVNLIWDDIANASVMGVQLPMHQLMRSLDD